MINNRRKIVIYNSDVLPVEKKITLEVEDVHHVSFVEGKLLLNSRDEVWIYDLERIQATLEGPSESTLTSEHALYHYQGPLGMFKARDIYRAEIAGQHLHLIFSGGFRTETVNKWHCGQIRNWESGELIQERFFNDPATISTHDFLSGSLFAGFGKKVLKWQFDVAEQESIGMPLLETESPIRKVHFLGRHLLCVMDKEIVLLDTANPPSIVRSWKTVSNDHVVTDLFLQGTLLITETKAANLVRIIRIMDLKTGLI